MKDVYFARLISPGGTLGGCDSVDAAIDAARDLLKGAARGSRVVLTKVVEFVDADPVFPVLRTPIALEAEQDPASAAPLGSTVPRAA